MSERRPQNFRRELAINWYKDFVATAGIGVGAVPFVADIFNSQAPSVNIVALGVASVSAFSSIVTSNRSERMVNGQINNSSLSGTTRDFLRDIVPKRRPIKRLTFAAGAVVGSAAMAPNIPTAIGLGLAGLAIGMEAEERTSLLGTKFANAVEGDGGNPSGISDAKR